MDSPQKRENEISFIIRAAIFKVYNELGPGLLESAYQAVLLHELRKSGLMVRAEVAVPLLYEEVKLEVGYRLDLLIEDCVLVEIKSIEQLNPVHHKQVLTYLKLSRLKLGLLVNFNTDNIQHSIYRKVNGL